MGRVKSEYEVESLFIDRLQEMGYEFITMKTYDDLIENFKKQICELNSENLIEAKGTSELSDSEFDRIMLRLDNHTVYESAKILREQWVLELDNGKIPEATNINEIQANKDQIVIPIEIDMKIVREEMK